MIIVFIIIGLIVLLVLRVMYTFYTVGAYKRAWSMQNKMPIKHNVLVVAALGDSTVQGVGALRRSGGFVPQAKKRIEKQTGKEVQIYNFSATGAETREVLETQVPKLKELKHVEAVIIAVGPNDITHKKSLEDFLENYKQILEAVPVEKTVISNLPPIGPKDVDGKNSYQWSRALVELVEDLPVVVAPVFETISPKAHDLRTYGGDFYHPSRVGYKLWANAFTPKLLDVLRPSLDN